jgi:hypothetical protein
MGDSWDRSCSATLRTLRPLWAGRNKAVFRTLANQLLWKPRLFEALMRAHDTASLLGPAARGAARLLMEIALATPRRVYISAGVAALVAGIGANALLLQMGRHPAPLLASVAHDPLPASASTAAPAGTVEPVALYAPPTPTSEYSTASAAAPPGGDISRATQASAPDTTASIAPAAQDKQHQSSAPNGERRSAALGPDQIGAASPTTDRPSCALPRSRSRSSDTRSSPMASKMAPPGGPFAISSVRTG